MLLDTDLKALEDLALRLGSGQWHTEYDGQADLVVLEDGQPVCEAFTLRPPGKNALILSSEVVQYFAALRPEVVLQLVAIARSQLAVQRSLARSRSRRASTQSAPTPGKS